MDWGQFIHGPVPIEEGLVLSDILAPLFSLPGMVVMSRFLVRGGWLFKFLTSPFLKGPVLLLRLLLSFVKKSE